MSQKRASASHSTFVTASLISLGAGSVVAFGPAALNLTIGPLSPQAWLTIATLLLSSAILLIRALNSSISVNGFLSLLGWETLILLVFVFWSALRTVISLDISREALQPTVLLVAFLTTLVFFRLLGRGKDLFLNLIYGSGVVGSTASAFAEILGNQIFLSGHSSMALLVPFAIGLAKLSRGLVHLVPTMLIFQALILGNSRMVIAVAILIVALASTVLTTYRIQFRVALLASWTSILATNFVLSSRLQERFVSPGDRAVSIPSVTGLEDGTELVLNTNGRVNVWTELFNQLEAENLLFGRGPGFSAQFVFLYAGWDHPHNEYLRILVDLGLVGLLLFLAFCLVALLSTKLHKPQISYEQFIRLAVIAILLLLSITDLPLVAFGVMIPSAITLGVFSPTLSQSLEPFMKAR